MEKKFLALRYHYKLTPNFSKTRALLSDKTLDSGGLFPSGGTKG